MTKEEQDAREYFIEQVTHEVASLMVERGLNALEAMYVGLAITQTCGEELANVAEEVSLH